MHIFPPFDAPHKWRAVDDRVRGGSSTSHLDPIPGTSGGVLFHGHLDTQTLGGAGFASQVYAFAKDEPLRLDPNTFTGFKLGLLPLPPTDGQCDQPHDESGGQGRGGYQDEKRPVKPFKYTLVLKTDIPPRRPDGRRESTLNYEYTFSYSSHHHHRHHLTHSIPWSQFDATYRGKPVSKGDAKYEPLDPTKGITEISFMCRSGFGKQEGAYHLAIASLSAMEARGHHGDVVVELDEKQACDEEIEEKTRGYGTFGDDAFGQNSQTSQPPSDHERASWFQSALHMVSRL